MAYDGDMVLQMLEDGTISPRQAVCMLGAIGLVNEYSYYLQEELISSSCDCGALKANTTHVDWCSTRGAK